MERLTRIRRTWRESGETRQVTWKYVRRALILGALSLGITLASIVVWIGQTRHEAAAKAHQQCVARVEARADLRGAFVGIFDYLDPDHTSVKVNDLRVWLDAHYEPLSVKDC